MMRQGVTLRDPDSPELRSKYHSLRTWRCGFMAQRQVQMNAVCQAKIMWLEQTAEQIQFRIAVWHHEYDLFTWKLTHMFDRPATGSFRFSSDAIVTLRDWRITCWAMPSQAGQLGCEIAVEHPQYDICARTVSKALQRLLAPEQLIVDLADACWEQHHP